MEPIPMSAVMVMAMMFSTAYVLCDRLLGAARWLHVRAARAPPARGREETIYLLAHA